MDEYIFTNAQGYSIAQLSRMHNESFTGYFMPAIMTPEMTAEFFRLYQVDFARTVVMHDQSGTFVGIARIATRGKRGWCGGFGIAPTFRGKGAGHLLAAQMVQVARESGLATLQLEVLSQNEHAIRIYEKAGFVHTRRLFGLQITADLLPAGVLSDVEVVPFETLLPFLRPQQACWQRELPTIMSAPVETVVARNADGRINGLVIQRAGDKVRIHAMVVQNDLSDVELATLLRHAGGEASTLSIYNEPEGSPLLARLAGLGFTEFFSQYEMIMTL